MDSTNANTAPHPASQPGLHKPFLERAAAGEAAEKNLGLGAFLVMRLVDQFGVHADNPGRDAVEYQCCSTRAFIDDIRPRSQTSSMLYEVTRVADAALDSSERRLLFPPLLALASHYENELRFEEGLDVIETALRLSDGRDGEDEVAAHLNRARILRTSTRLPEARVAYERAGMMALRLGDRHSGLLSQIGCGIVARQVGNLPESEQILEKVVNDARGCGDRDAEARACQDLAGTLYFAGRIQEATPLAFNAYELYDTPQDKARALSDTGAMLKELGHYAAARNAFGIVLSGELTPDVRARTELECIEVSALVGDRLSFERWRHSVLAKYEKLPQDIRMDFELSVGAGLSQFEEHDRAEMHIERAITMAEQLGMGERAFAAVRQLEEARERRESPWTVPESLSDTSNQNTGVRDTIERLEVLATAERG